MPIYILSQNSPLTFSEVMFYPSEQNGEFIEIYNTSSTDTINLANYKIKYYTSSNNSFTSLIGGTKLAPGKFAVILQGNYDFTNGIYKSLIPSDAIVLKLTTSNFGSSGMANTTSRTIYLIDPAGQTVDVYTYSADNSPGISDEKIILNKDNNATNWKNSYKTHGTPGSKNSVSPLDFDLQVKLFNIYPQVNYAKDSLRITLVIKNLGRVTAEIFSVNIFNDLNNNLKEDSNENIFYKSYSYLQSGDSILIQKSIYIELAATYKFVADVLFDKDETMVNNRVIIDVKVFEQPVVYNDIVINEIMYAPLNDEPEWVELYNKSEKKINLKDWRIGDNTSSIVISYKDTFLNAKEFLVITKDSSLLNFYNVPSVLVIRSLPTLNNTGDDVVLKNSEGKVIDSVRYNPSFGGTSGKSLERVSYYESSLAASNWGSSISIKRATPGKVNSLTKKNFDLSIISVITNSQIIEVGKSLLINLSIKNIGKEIVENSWLKVYKDKNGNSITDQSELILSKNILVINPDDIVQLEVVIDSISEGENKFIFNIDFMLDEFTDNNFYYYTVNGISITENKYDLIINEIMYAPNNDEPEWIELYNRSNKTINLKNWKIGDNSALTTIISNNYEIKPGEYVVICRDSSIINFYPNISKVLICQLPTLNNSGDAVRIKDIYNRTIDSLSYLSNWGGNNGKSLERKSSELISTEKSNWMTSVSKLNGTPGKINSISDKDYDLKIVSFLSKLNYAEVGKDIELIVTIKNIGRKNAENFKIQLVKDENLNGIIDDFLCEEKNISLLETNREIQINFLVNNISYGRNQFIIFVNYNNDEFGENNIANYNINGVKIIEQKYDVVINEIMYAPLLPEPEWIEIYNRSNKSINLKGYKLGNNTSKSVITKEERLLKPQSFCVIAKDSSITLFYDQIENLLICNFPQLNNNGGVIILCDSLNRIIDSVYYKSSWGGRNGKTLERISPSKSSVDSTNWKTAINKKATPSKKNSVTPFNYDLELECYNISPSTPIIGDTTTLRFIIRNKGELVANNVIFQLFENMDCDSNKNKYQLLNTYSFPNLTPGDSILIFQKLLEYEIGYRCLAAKINFSEDEDTSNNIINLQYSVLSKPSKYNDVVVNEIMYAPRNDEPEWIEIFNRTDEKINVNNWVIGDGLRVTKIISKDFYIEPNEFLVISKDSSIINYYISIPKIIVCDLPSLNNSGDVLFIKDSFGKTIDSLRYYSNWSRVNGNSLERVDVNISSVDKNNWCSSLSKFNATPGKINSVAQKNYDIEIVSFLSDINYVEVGNNIILKCKIKNAGKKRAVDIELLLFKYENEVNKNEIYLDKKVISYMEPSQVLDFEFVVSEITIGKNNFILKINYLNDEYDENNIVYFSVSGVLINEQKGDIVINELMYAPVNQETEWIEIYNTSNKPINLRNFRIGNNKNKVVITSKDKIILPDNYIVIAKDSNIFFTYSKIENIEIVNFPALNNNSGIVILTDSLNRIIDSVYYKSTWGGNNGKSLERVDSYSLSNDSTNWKSSLMDKGTPCRKNSVSRKNYDFAIVSYLIEPEKPTIGDKVKLILHLKNNGRNYSGGILKLYVLEKNSYMLIKEIPIAQASPNNIIKLEIENEKNLLSKTCYKVVLEDTLDEDLSNNSTIINIYPKYSYGAILINEIMYNPVNGEPEWIEVYNNTNYDINLAGWSISDVLSKPLKIKFNEAIVPKKSFAIVCKDSSIIYYHKNILSEIIVNQFPNLNNDADGIVIKDFYDNIIDSVFYEKNMGGQNGKSLERKSLLMSSTERSNWDSSIDIELSTPGRVNSISRKTYDIAIKKISTEPKIINSGDKIYLTVTIMNRGLTEASNIFIKFFYEYKGTYEFFDQLFYNNLLPGDSIEVISSKFITVNRDILVYCRVFMDNDEDTLNNYLEKQIRINALPKSVLINEIMYNPYEGESEWIEIVNVSDNPINLKGWVISDLLPSQNKALITNKDEYLKPNEYAVITHDTSNFYYNPPVKFYQVKFGTLNNTSDGVIIYDFNGKIIDSIFYKSSWGYKKGCSLERKSYFISSTDSTNWFLSLDKNGATPGKENSLKRIKEIKRNSIVFNEIMYEPETGNAEFIELFNATNDTIQIGGLSLLVNKNKIVLLPFFYEFVPQSYFLIASDSSVFKRYIILDSKNITIDKSLSLLNSGSELILKDVYGNTIDSLYYLPTWHNKNFADVTGKSLERINPYLNTNDRNNWSTSVSNEGATPLKQNSIYTAIEKKESKVTISPNPFSPDNDGFEDFAIINFSLANKVSQVRIRVYDSQGRLVRTIENNMPAVSSNSVIFDGLDDSSRPLRVGIYVLFMEIISEDGKIETIKIPIVIARKL
ncbi:MAG: lamin tail domain-containing protein [Melioribacter sp.]|nr:lamin tail domain-containing protein [Melioribacter sp.]